MTVRWVARRIGPQVWPRRDEGSVSVFAVIAAVIMILFVGVAVDLGGKVHTAQHAQDVARQAARAAAEAAHAPSAVRGQSASVDSTKAVAAAQAYLAASDLPGQVSVSGDLVTVTTTATYTPVILSLTGIGSQTLTGTSTARLERVLAGTQR